MRWFGAHEDILTFPLRLRLDGHQGDGFIYHVAFPVKWSRTSTPMTKSSAWPTETMKKARKQRTFQVVSRVSKLFFHKGARSRWLDINGLISPPNQITAWDIKHLNKKTTGATHPPRPEMSTKKVAYFYDDEIGNFHYGSVLFCVLRCPFCSYRILFSPCSFNTTLLFYTDIHTQ